MDERWCKVARVRELRAQAALNEAVHRNQIEARAKAALDQARKVQARYEELAAQTSVAASLHDSGGSTTRFKAVEAQMLLSYSVSARLKAQAATGPIRRAHFTCQHAWIAASEARKKYRRAVERRDAIVSYLQGRRKEDAHRLLEREEEALADDRSCYVHMADGGQGGRR